MYLSMVVPCFNEEHGLQRLHDALVEALAGVVRDYEVILVDDGSTDRTLSEARRLSEHDPRFRYVSLSRNFGKEPAMLCGLRHARGSRVALLDADLQHPPGLLPRMLVLLDTGYDQVVARRSRSGETAWRTALSRTYYRLSRRWLDVRLQDGAGDFRVLSRRAVDALVSLPEQHRFSKGLFAWIGFDTGYVTYRDVPRETGESRWRLAALVDHGIDGLTSFNDKPLRPALLLGLLTAAFACAAGTLVEGQQRWAAALLGLGGVQVFLLGVLGEYLGRTCAEARRRPHYVVKESSPLPNAFAGEHRLRTAELVS
ncbi:glycosyltransferase family 2 protein [Saccharopolyspora mangrovi]|uniref:Glycosyltransferase family 2 protein n=1 Tax=Saccharopolyspora mangrovi TaxID=3082379 RepID=A0ABU6AGI7_9PSEU|nr:glycosyltransferase family 2 protein [Saccharopolyspora sp. S2-29]MEB3370440.1 glycosyltransferase family 2 protein [Saccharopolyspora sp. S2-29]